MTSIRPLIPLLIAAGILLAGNGLQGTFIAIRGAEEGFSASLIRGLWGTAYFAGFLLGCVAIPRLLQSVGHIRTFAALAAIAAAATIAMVMWIDAVWWIVMRLVIGFCFSGLFTTVDSWINSSVANKDRGRVLSLYRLIDLASVTGGQFFVTSLRYRRNYHLWYYCNIYLPFTWYLFRWQIAQIQNHRTAISLILQKSGACHPWHQLAALRLASPAVHFAWLGRFTPRKSGFRLPVSQPS